MASSAIQNPDMSSQNSLMLSRMFFYVFDMGDFLVADILAVFSRQSRRRKVRFANPI